MVIDDTYLNDKEKDVLEDVLTAKDPNTWLDDEVHAYYMACQLKSLRLARVLHDLGLSPNYPNRDGSTALSWAPNYEFTAFFVSNGARIEFEKPESKTLSLHHAALTGKTDQLEILLSNADGELFLEAFDEFGRTPLAAAAQCGHLGAVKFLLKSGSNPNAYDEEFLEYTVLQHAVAKGNQEIAKILIEHGANPKTHWGMTQTPLELAKEQMLDPSFIDLLK